MGSEQSTVSHKPNNISPQKMYEKHLREQNKMYEEMAAQKFQEQQMMQSSQGNKGRDVSQNSTLTAEKQLYNVSLYPNVPQLETGELQSSTSNAHNHVYPSNSRHQYKSIFESPAPTEPMRPISRSPPIPSPRRIPLETNTTLQQNPSQLIDGVKRGTGKEYISTYHHLEVSNVNLPKKNIKNIVKVNCPNKDCTLFFKPEKMQAHSKVCLFREWECPLAAEYRPCSWQGKIHQIKNHFLEDHPGQTGVKEETEISFDLNETYYFINYVAKENYNFLVHVKLDNNLEALLMAVQVIGSPASASKWLYKFQVYVKSEPRRKFTFTDACLPTSIQFSDIANEAKCAVLPMLYALSFFKDNKLTYKFNIINTEIKQDFRNRSVLPTSRVN